MVAMYEVAGRKVGSHILAMATLGGIASIAIVPSLLKSKPKNPAPPIKAESGDEEKFIQEFLKEVEANEKAAKH